MGPSPDLPHLQRQNCRHFSTVIDWAEKDNPHRPKRLRRTEVRRRTDQAQGGLRAAHGDVLVAESSTILRAKLWEN